MATPLVDRNTGDVIPASDHNDVKDYIEDAQYRVNTSALHIGGSVVIDSNQNGSFVGSLTALSGSVASTLLVGSLGVNTGSVTHNLTVYNSGQAPMKIVRSETANNGALTVLDLEAQTSSASNGAIGIGPRIRFLAENSSGSQTTAGWISGLMTNVTTGSESGDIVFYTNGTNFMSERLRIVGSTGQISLGLVGADQKLAVAGDGRFTGNLRIAGSFVAGGISATLNAGSVTQGTLSDSRLPTSMAGKTFTSDILGTNGSFTGSLTAVRFVGSLYGDAANITNVPVSPHNHDGSAITTGTVSDSRLPSSMSGKTFTSDLFGTNGSFTGSLVATGFTGAGTNITGVVHTTGNESIDGNKTFSGTTTFNGSALFNGSVTQVNSNNVTVTDNEIVLNNGEAGAGITAGSAGLRVDRGSGSDALLYFRESDDQLVFNIDGQTGSVVSYDWHTHDGSVITTGTVADARLPSSLAGKTFTSDILGTNGSFTGSLVMNGTSYVNGELRINGKVTDNSLIRFTDDGTERGAVYTLNSVDDLHLRGEDKVKILTDGGTTALTADGQHIVVAGSVTAVSGSFTSTITAVNGSIINGNLYISTGDNNGILVTGAGRKSLLFKPTGTTNRSYIGWYDILGSTMWSIESDRLNTGSNKDLYFYTPNLSGDTRYVLYLGSSGNIGLGTTAPSHKLTVAGDGNFTGTVISPYGSYTGSILVGSLYVATNAIVNADLTINDDVSIIGDLFGRSNGSISGSFLIGNVVSTGTVSGVTGSYTGSLIFQNAQTSGPIMINPGFGNTGSRPAVDASRIAGEISGYSSVGGTAGDDGFIRLSAGGGTTNTTKSFIDLAGYSQVADVNRTIVFGTAGSERARFDANGSFRVAGPISGSLLNINGTIGGVTIYGTNGSFSGSVTAKSVVVSGNSTDAWDFVSNKTTTIAALGKEADTTATHWLYRNVGSGTSAGPVVLIEQDHADDDQPALVVQQDRLASSIIEANYGATKRFVVLGTGSVGIGVDAPTHPLQVVTGTSTWFFEGGGGVLSNNRAGAVYFQATDTSGEIRLRTGGTSDRFTVTPTGSVGIGTTSAPDILTVAGNGSFSGNLKTNGSIAMNASTLTFSAGSAGIVYNSTTDTIDFVIY